MSSKWQLLDRNVDELLGSSEQLWQMANSLARLGESRAASAVLGLLGRLVLVNKAARDLERVRALLKGNTRVPRFVPGEIVLLRDGYVAQVVLVRASMVGSGQIIYDLQSQGRFLQGVAEERMCATLEEYAGYLPLMADDQKEVE